MKRSNQDSLKKAIGIAFAAAIVIGGLLFGWESRTPAVNPPNSSVIVVGMEYEQAKDMLDSFSAEKTWLSIMPSEEGMDVESYIIKDNPHIIITFKNEGGRNIIKGLALHYRVGTKADPRNKWLDVKEINLMDISKGKLPEGFMPQIQP